MGYWCLSIERLIYFFLDSMMDNSIQWVNNKLDIYVDEYMDIEKQKLD